MTEFVMKVCNTIVACRAKLDVIENDPNWPLCDTALWQAVNAELKRRGQTIWLHDTFIMTRANNFYGRWP